MRKPVAQHRLLRHLVGVGIVIIFVGIVAASSTLHNYADVLIVWIEGLIVEQPYLGMAAFVGMSMLSAMVAFFSSAVFVPVAIYAWGNVSTFILLWSGWLLGGIASLCIGRFLGRRVAAALIGEEKIAGWQSQLDQHTKFVHVLLFQAIVPSEIPGYVLGILRYPFLLYLLALAITELPYVVGVVFLGEYFLQGESLGILLLGIVVVALGILLIRLRVGVKEPDQSD